MRKIICITAIITMMMTSGCGLSSKDDTAEITRLNEEIARLKESERQAIIARSKAENDYEALKSENDSMNDTIRRNKQQLEAMTKENEKLKSEVDRLTKKLNNSLVRIANPFK